MKRNKKKFMVVDLETTGNQSSQGDRIIQFAGTLVEDGQIVQTYSTFINPKREIPTFIRNLTGIKKEDVQKAPLFEDVAETIQALLDDTVFVAHNVSFDWTFLEKEMGRLGIEMKPMRKLDTVELSHVLFPSAHSYKLQDLAEEFGFVHKQVHRADSDSIVTAKVLIHCLKKLESLPLAVLRKMATVSQQLKSDLPTLIFEAEMHKERANLPLESDLIEHRGIVIRKKHIEKPVYPLHEGNQFPNTDEAKKRLFEQAEAALFARPGQFQMMDAVYAAMKANEHALIEAGTGIGKSLGYFLPAVYFAKQKQLPVVISTYTNLLQTQLYEKDIPLIAQLVDFDIKATLLKGRSHYLNLFKFEQLLTEKDPQYDVVITKLKLLVWLTETTTGDISEVNLSSGGKLFWNRMKHTGRYLSAQQDPWAHFDFYNYNLKQAKHADLVIINHALLLADHFSSQKLLPDYSYAIIDEAHHFPESMRAQSSFSFSYRKLKYFLRQLNRIVRSPLFNHLEQTFPTNGYLEKLSHVLFQLNESVEEFFASLHQFLHQSKREKTEKVVVENTSTGAWDENIFFTAEKVLALLRATSQLIQRFLKVGKRKENVLKEKEAAFIEEMYTFLLEFNEIAAQIDQMLHANQQEVTIYLTSDKSRSLNGFRLYAISLNIEESLRDRFFAQKDSVVLTSATLTVNERFTYIKKKLGLEGKSVKEIRIPSPFRYEKNARILIPTDMPPIKEVPIHVYATKLAYYLAEMAQITKGRMLVLFTANEMLKRTVEVMKQIPTLEEFILLAQGISSGSRARLVKEFQAFNKAILLGTSSFWEGIDIPGEDLSCLVIVRLPFVSLDDPYTKAQISRRKNRNENAFQTYSLPEAILKFKQGFGRLIRRETDRGIVFVVDNRIDTTKFGQRFLNSIPTAPVIKGDKTILLQAIDKFFNSLEQ